MDNKQILKQLEKELKPSLIFWSFVHECEGEHVLHVHRHDELDYNLVFRVGNNLLMVAREYYTMGPMYGYKRCDVIVGEINIKNIIACMNLFAEYGKAHCEYNPSMKKLLKNDRFMKTKSARNIE